VAIGGSIGLILILVGGECGYFLGGCILAATAVVALIHFSKVKKLEEANEAMSKVLPRILVLRYKGQCPYCDTSIWLPPVPGADCPACNKRVIIRDSKFYSVETPVSGVQHK
jgi:hypothetical protein